MPFFNMQEPYGAGISGKESLDGLISDSSRYQYPTGGSMDGVGSRLEPNDILQSVYQMQDAARPFRSMGAYHSESISLGHAFQFPEMHDQAPEIFHPGALDDKGSGAFRNSGQRDGHLHHDYRMQNPITGGMERIEEETHSAHPSSMAPVLLSASNPTSAILVDRDQTDAEEVSYPIW
jgi:hypothetical protein